MGRAGLVAAAMLFSFIGGGDGGGSAVAQCIESAPLLSFVFIELAVSRAPNSRGRE